MKLICLFTLLSICIPALAEGSLPKDVTSFLELRESCDHWRGEHGYDKDRQADIDWSICQSCSGTDAKLARLKRKYSGKENILVILNELEPEVEPKDKSAARLFCKKTRKPEWYK